MREEVLVKVEGVSKKFCKDLKRSLWYGLQDITSELLGLKKTQQLRKDEFWAVNDVSFELRRGECLGLIGHNGAGKSTLLKMLNGLINPDKGKITMKGRIGALIELGAGFNPILTGRENVFNNGAVLGFSQKEIAAKYKAIVEFAELEEFMDTPVQNYSSGMKVRLGFAVAAQMEPDVLIIDEVLAVGDVGFSIKCLNSIQRIVKTSAVIFVTHSMPLIGRICSSTLLIEKGSIKVPGMEISKAIEAYLSKFQTNELSVLGAGNVSLISFILCNDFGHVIDNITFGGHMRLKFSIACHTLREDLYIQLVIFNQEQRPITEVISSQGVKVFESRPKTNFDISISSVYLNPGIYTYSLSVKSSKDQTIYLRIDGLSRFIVQGSFISWADHFQPSNWNIS